MAFCHSCSQPVEADWSACPFCSSLLPSSNQGVGQPVAPFYSPQPSYPTYNQAMPQQQYQNHNQAIPQQQYQAPQTQYTSTQIRNNGANGAKIIAVIAVMAVVGIILAMGLYAWAAALSSSQYSWSGDVDSRVTGVRWYDSEGEWERDLSNGDLEWSSGNQADYEELEVTSLHTSYDWPYASHKFRSDSSDWSTMNVEVHMQIIGDVWFVQITAVNFDGDYTSFDDGECYAIIHEDAYWGSSSWRQQVGSTSWPHFCDSVDDY